MEDTFNGLRESSALTGRQARTALEKCGFVAQEGGVLRRLLRNQLAESHSPLSMRNIASALGPPIWR